MAGKRIILSSKSPRRQALIKELGFPYEVRVKDVDELYPSDISPRKVPGFLAELKASVLKEHLANDEVLLTSDTIVLFQGKILGKPIDKNDAIDMLKGLSGEMHEVLTGYHLYSNEHSVTKTVTTEVYFGDLTDAEITYYVNKYEPYDKAGSYGIQEWIGYIGIPKIEGCYYNVMGLPVNSIYRTLLDEFNFSN